MDGQMDKWTDGQELPLCSTGLWVCWPTSSQIFLNEYINQFTDEQGKGIADHMLPLGD